MKHYIQQLSLLVLVLVLSLAACAKTDESYYSVPLPETLNGRIVDEKGNSMSGLIVYAEIVTVYDGYFWQRMPREEIVRYLKFKTDAGGQYSFDFTEESRKIISEYPLERPVLAKSLTIKVKGYKYKYFGLPEDSVLVIKKADLVPLKGNPTLP